MVLLIGLLSSYLSNLPSFLPVHAFLRRPRGALLIAAVVCNEHLGDIIDTTLSVHLHPSQGFGLNLKWRLSPQVPGPIVQIVLTESLFFFLCVFFFLYHF